MQNNMYTKKCKGPPMFAGWAVLATALSAGRVDVGANFMAPLSQNTLRSSSHPVRIGFPIHNELRAAESCFLCTQRSLSRPGPNFIYCNTKNFIRKT